MIVWKTTCTLAGSRRDPRQNRQLKSELLTHTHLLINNVIWLLCVYLSKLIKSIPLEQYFNEKGMASTISAVSNAFAHYTTAERKPQARLTADQVAQIFMCRGSNHGASKVCLSYGVSEKAVRDIWTGRTWAKETRHLGTSRRLEIRKMGRPTGCKDKQPRKTRGAFHQENVSKDAVCKCQSQQMVKFDNYFRAPCWANGCRSKHECQVAHCKQ